ncbi:MAG TPA: class IV adenylate cyclase [Pyrinomonadaceae bacterium]|nr:class IV adenylate cyclase [Pyrinomonadaceae bacterium]
MSIEIEKKFRLTRNQREQVLQRLPEIGAKRKGEEFEVNTLYGGESLDTTRAVLRLRRIGNRGILTYKQSLPPRLDLKFRREDETRVADPAAMELILEALGLVPVLVYEKRRETWRLGRAELVLDELPFGLFMEIEGSETDIREVENQLAIKRLRVEVLSYPRLVLKRGVTKGTVVESRFGSTQGKTRR